MWSGPRIQPLPEVIANQIAAGEVIERPASVVKELLENAADAGADAITVEIGFGGLNHIRVSDNGHGIYADDLCLAVQAHATSKIHHLSDLQAIKSLGFRGEALASIASVSRFCIDSKPPDQPHAMRLSVENGQHHIVPCARSQGTTIEVNDLFFNAPVRKKFLKSEQTEFKAIDMVVKRFAMSRTDLRIQLIHNGKCCFDLPKANHLMTRKARVAKLLGKPFIEEAIGVDIKHLHVHLRGWLGHSTYQLSQNDKQWFYLNGRMIKDKLIHHAIKQAYEPWLHPGKHPACLLYLDMPLDEVDVNVHPTKHEVRFQAPRLIHDFLVSQLTQALQTHQPDAGDAAPKKARAHAPHSRLTALHHTKEMEVPTAPWRIDRQYQLMPFEHELYLVDTFALKRQWWQHQLDVAHMPLPSRPLLVPVFARVSAHRANDEVFTTYLAQAGIQTQWQGEGLLLVKSIPVTLPHLDIASFFLAYDGITPSSLQGLSEVLVEHACEHEDDEVFLAFLRENMASFITQTAYCRVLSATVCRALFHV